MLFDSIMIYKVNCSNLNSKVNLNLNPISSSMYFQNTVVFPLISMTLKGNGPTKSSIAKHVACGQPLQYQFAPNCNLSYHWWPVCIRNALQWNQRSCPSARSRQQSNTSTARWDQSLVTNFRKPIFCLSFSISFNCEYRPGSKRPRILLPELNWNSEDVANHAESGR